MQTNKDVDLLQVPSDVQLEQDWETKVFYLKCELSYIFEKSVVWSPGEGNCGSNCVAHCLQSDATNLLQLSDCNRSTQFFDILYPLHLIQLQ